MSLDAVLSVVIPTRNRTEYALAAIRHVLSIDQPDLQLVVQDNSDDDALRHLSSDLAGDPRFVYHYSPGTLSFVDNFNEAIRLATGEYVTIIGDDDGINPEVLTAVRWARAHGIRAIRPGLQAVYFWPRVGLPITQDTGDAGLLLLHAISGRATVRGTAPGLRRLFHEGCQDYLERDLVKLYHGIVHRDVLEQVRSTAGDYFGGLSPDIYAAVALSAVNKEVLTIDYPLTIAGICPTSGSADSGNGRHTGDLRDAPHFVGHASYEWAPEVPRFYSVETIWADSALAAARDMRRDDLLMHFSPARLALACEAGHPEYGSLAVGHYYESQEARGWSEVGARAALQLARAQIRLWAGIRRRLPQRSGTPIAAGRMDHVRDIAQASQLLRAHLDDAGITVLPCLERLVRRIGPLSAALHWPF